MAASTMPILAIAGVTLFNDVIIENKSFVEELKVGAAAGIAVLIFAGLEKVNTAFAVGVAYIGLVTAIVAPLAADHTSFAERASRWFAASGVGA